MRIKHICLSIIGVIMGGCNPSIRDSECVEEEQCISIINDIMFIDGLIGTSRVSMIFDTGCLVGCVLSKTIAKEVLPKKDIKYSVNDYGVIEVDSMFIAGFQYHFKEIIVHKERENSPLIAPQYSTDRSVWSFNLDSCSLVISDSSRLGNSSKVPIVFSEKRGLRSAPFVKLPIKLCLQGDTLKTSYYYLLDTGTPYSMAITDPPEELVEFVRAHSYTEYIDELSRTSKLEKFCSFIPTSFLKTTLLMITNVLLISE